MVFRDGPSLEGGARTRAATRSRTASCAACARPARAWPASRPAPPTRRRSPGTPTAACRRVDNVDDTAGRAALVFVLAGAEGDYGVRDTADALLPKVAGGQPSP